jgi:SAM-dependent methyltransferase
MTKPDNFIDIPFTKENLDLYIVRTSILKAINWALPHLHGDLLDIGCGKMPYKEYILQNSEVNNYTGLDIETALEYDAVVRPDNTWDGITMPFENGMFDCAFGTEVLEHCPEPEVVLKETHRVLKSGGVFFFTVPFLWNLHEVPHDEYRYTPFSLERHLRNSGFNDIEIYATGGWHLAMAQMLGLWVKRSPIRRLGGIRRGLLNKVVFYTMIYLINLSKKESIQFKKGQMITGLYGIVRKY